MSDFSDFCDMKRPETPIHTPPMFFSRQLRASSPPPASPIDDTKDMGSSHASVSEVDPTKDNFVPPVAVVDSVVLDSFLPLLQSLEQPGLVEVIGGTYHLSGTVTEEASKKLSGFASRVVKFTLTDWPDFPGGPTMPHIDNGTWFRILQLRSRHSQYLTAFFPSLKDLRITGVGSDSLVRLSLFNGSPLESLEISNIAKVPYETHTNKLLIFLRMLAKEAPSLSNLTLDDSVSFSSVARPTYTSFRGLRRLQVVVSDYAALSWKDLQDIGELQSLEELSIDTGMACYSQIPCPAPECLPVPLPEPAPEPPNFPVLYGDWDAPGKPDTVKKTATPPRAPSPTPSIPDIGDDVLVQQPRKPAKIVEELFSSPPLPGYHKLTKLHIRGELNAMKDLIGMISPAAAIAEISLALVKKVVKPVGKKESKKGHGKDPMPMRHAEPKVPPIIETQTTHFDDLVGDVLSSWGNSLLMLCARATVDPRPIISLPTFQRLLSMPLLERLEVSGCTLHFDFGNALHYLTRWKRPSYLKVLHLPVEAGANGISFNRLRSIFECYPSLESFRCGFKHLSNIPAFPEDGITFKRLNSFTAGNPNEHDSHPRLIEAAQYLDALFPNLKMMETHKDCNARQWEEIFSLVKMCQNSRSYHAK